MAAMRVLQEQQTTPQKNTHTHTQTHRHTHTHTRRGSHLYSHLITIGCCDSVVVTWLTLSLWLAPKYWLTPPPLTRPSLPLSFSTALIHWFRVALLDWFHLFVVAVDVVVDATFVGSCVCRPVALISLHFFFLFCSLPILFDLFQNYSWVDFVFDLMRLV